MHRYNYFSITVTARRLVLTFLLLGFMALLATSASPVSAVPAGVTFSRATPVNGNTLLVARTAANNPLDPPTFQLKADIFLNNSGMADQEVSSVTVSYPGSGISSRSYTPMRFPADDPPENYSIVAGPDETLLPVYDGLGRDLPIPLPATVQIEIFFDGDANPLVLNFGLAIRDNAVPLKAHFFPALQSDLPAGQYWQFGTRHVVDSGGGGGTLNPTAGSQKYAIDMGVVRWDGSVWTGLKDSTDGSENDDFLSWEVPLYAMGDGTILSCYRGEVDHAPGSFDDITFENTFGNSLVIQHGNEFVAFAHFRFGTIPLALCPGPGQNNGLSIPVEAGQFLGRMGNTGRSTAPHLHWQVGSIPSGTVGGAPMQFLNIRALADQDTVNNLGGSPTLQPLHGMTLHKHSLVSPNPCGFEFPATGFVEVARHGIPAECYQDIFNMIVHRGYRPVFVDGYNVGGNNFFNATFRAPGPAWVARHGLTGSEYQDLFDDMDAAGFRLHQVDSYLDGGGIRYAAIFEQRPGPNFSAFHGLNDAEYSDEVDDLAAAGYVPVNVSTVEVGGNRFWTGLFEQVSVNGWTVETVDAVDYQNTFDANVNAGRLPIYVHGFSTTGGPQITGIWIDTIGGSWAAVHGLNSNDYQAAWDANTGTGKFTRAVTGYDGGGGTAVFGAVWRVRPNTTITSTPPTPTNQTTATFGFVSDNPFTTFECRLDGSLYTLCNSPKTHTSLAEGFHTFYTRAVDRETVRDLTPDSFTWLVDVTPPTVNIVAPVEGTQNVNGVFKDFKDETTVVGWADIVAIADDNLSGVASVVFEVNGVPVPAAEVTQQGNMWSFLFEPDLKGSNDYLIKATATDNASNSAMTSIELIGVATGKKMK